MDWTKSKPTQDSMLEAELNRLLGRRYSGHAQPLVEAVQHTMTMAWAKREDEAKQKNEAKKGDKAWRGSEDGPQIIEHQAYEDLYDAGEDTWPVAEQNFEEVMNTKRDYLVKVRRCWKTYKTIDTRRKNKRNIFAATTNFMRKPPDDHLYFALDRNNKMFLFLDPEGLHCAYGKSIVDKMRQDTRKIFSDYKAFNKKGNKRHASMQANVDVDQSDTDHYGHWHARGQEDKPMIETGDSIDCAANEKQLLLRFLHWTCGTMTKPIDFWYGIWDRDLRQEYRRVYKTHRHFLSYHQQTSMAQRPTPCASLCVIDQQTSTWI